eukprot:564640_1
MASTEKKRKTKTKKTRASTSANPISPKAKPKRKSSTARSAFPTQEMSTQAMRKKMNEMEVTIKSLTRDNKVLARKIERMDMTSGKKTKKIDAEKDMRLNANKERYWLKQKLDRLQKAIEARLKLLGIDFSNINDLGEALEAAFAAIQKLAAELAKKEDELAAMQDKLDRAKKAQEDSAKEVDKLNRRVAKAKNANDDLKKQMADKDKRLDAMGKQKDSMSDKEKQKQNEMDKLRKELDALRKQKNKQFDNFVDKKAEMDKKLRDKDSECKELERELDDTKKKNEKLDAKNKKLEDELEKLRGLMDKQHEKLMAEKEKNKELKTEMDELRDELEDANKRNDKLKKANDALKEELDETKATLAEKEEMIKAQQKQIEENEARIQALEDDLKDRDAEIQRLKDENAALKDELAKLRALLEATQKELQDQKDKYAQLEKEKAEGEEEMQAMFSEQKEMNDMLKKKIANMTNKMKEQEQTIDDQDNQLSELKQALEDERRAKEAALATGQLNEQDSADAMSALTQEKKELKAMVDDLKGKMSDRDDEIARLKKALADAKKALDDSMNKSVYKIHKRPKDDTSDDDEHKQNDDERTAMILSTTNDVFDRLQMKQLLDSILPRYCLLTFGYVRHSASTRHIPSSIVNCVIIFAFYVPLEIRMNTASLNWQYHGRIASILGGSVQQHLDIARVWILRRKRRDAAVDMQSFFRGSCVRGKYLKQTDKRAALMMKLGHDTDDVFTRMSTKELLSSIFAEQTVLTFGYIRKNQKEINIPISIIHYVAIFAFYVPPVLRPKMEYASVEMQALFRGCYERSRYLKHIEKVRKATKMIWISYHRKRQRNGLEQWLNVKVEQRRLL